jgi:peptidoglycan-N-acetylglucosamine deacetylase
MNTGKSRPAATRRAVLVDWSRPGVPSIVANITRNTRTGSIILEHDGGGDRSQTLRALDVALPRLLDQGFTFVQL